MATTDLFNLLFWLEIARETTYNAARIARKLKISPRQLQRYTQKLFRCSPQHWLHERRLIDAMHQLEENHCVKSVAFQLGFKQACHFSREFKRRHGITPTEYLQIINCRASRNTQNHNTDLS
ncbi:helix-turn-helix domain-containing protein [Pedosphaera parvula]|uniref:Transcriptional regulator, AraC family n=1 Tax=Pedosphaera parvula (strain Ellin514) TaxID=320771 RepID=B9XHG7_PEDPL|nr:helix-turn-helix domain-containing protein [Pedosphaera parvula]EEF60802.1 transcriptional regulator, AraC family [Pedosphaera parvula Ellin514]